KASLNPLMGLFNAMPEAEAGNSGERSQPQKREARGDAAADSRFGWGNGWVRAPEYDDEHPDELYYRPFPLAPLLTTSASADDPVLAKLQHPDVAATLEFVSDEINVLPMRFTPGNHIAALLW